jgi:hypothetical protein
MKFFKWCKCLYLTTVAFLDECRRQIIRTWYMYKWPSYAQFKIICAKISEMKNK